MTSAHPFSKSLSAKLIFPILITTAMVALFGTLLSSWLAHQELAEQIRRRGEHLSGAVQYFQEIDNSRNGLVRMVNSIGGETDIRHMLVIDFESKMIKASNENTWIGMTIYELKPAYRDILNRDFPLASPYFAYEESLDTFIFVRKFPFYGTQSIGAGYGLAMVELLPPKGFISQRIYKVGGLLIAGFLILIILAVIQFRRVIHNPLNQMLDAMNRRSAGDVFARSPLQSQDELGHLSNVYNEMLTELFQAEERFEQLANHTTDVFWVFDITSRQRTYVNPAFERIWPHTREHLYQNQDVWLEGILPEDRGKLEIAFGSVLAGKETFTAIYRVSGQNGAVSWIKDTGLAVHNEQGRIYRIVGIAHDITAEKRMEDEYIRARDEAEHLANARSRFLANMSHEIRTPLNGILGASQLLLAMDLDHEQREWGSLINHSCRSLLAIINDILDLSKIEAGKLTIEKISFDLKAVLKDAFLLLDGTAKEKGLRLDVTYSGETFNYLLGDPVRIRQILVNLVGNAIKFTQGGEVMILVDVVHRNQNYFNVNIRVKDTGIGIPETKKHLIFGDFSQADNSISRQFGGTGLGLSISRKLARLMGGDITFESEEGVGSIFTLSLVMEKTNIRYVKESQEPGMLARNYGKRILLVEDNRVNQKVEQRMLQKLGLEVLLASNGQEAIETVSAEALDLIIMDMQMPVMDGLTATRFIRQKKLNEAPILAMTANAMKEDQDACYEAGMRGFLSKPIKLEMLVNELDKLLIREDEN